MEELGVGSWPEYIAQGRQYFKAARGGRKRPEVFTNELVSHLIGLSVEKLLMGLCLRHGRLPADHTLGGIVSEVQSLCPMERMLAEEIALMDRAQDLCALDPRLPLAMSDQRVAHMLETNARVAEYVEEKLQPRRSP
ncbi:MAG: hypothetical protein M0036_01870 [Desulfobacteraceae bacterium]|nr:hypothetical protein [Desulfobacteraceae bacterium]